MKAIEFKQQNVILAKSQPEYRELPAYKSKGGIILSCWALNVWERIKVLFTGKIYLSVLTFNKPLQPLLMETKFTKYEE